MAAFVRRQRESLDAVGETRTHGASQKRQHHGVIHEPKPGIYRGTGIFLRSGTWQGAQIKVLHGEMALGWQQLEALNGLKVGQSQFLTFLKQLG